MRLRSAAEETTYCRLRSLEMTHAGNANEDSTHGAGEMMQSIADGGWEITTRAAGFSDHREVGFPTQVLVGVEKQRKACPDLRVLTGSMHRSPAKRRNDAPQPSRRRNHARYRS
ncbi:hypothetical protein NDU88_002288 [Pleurodeles waltl]|uniref:Uncharacterized protein n=1 Tax=Pleurodeles waltl TaxID=8319 RepID=A0AAV7WKZ6_PLEWA|nr:hypothetical protein NDU88_002288 [Pleurodeles waltl]